MFNFLKFGTAVGEISQNYTLEDEPVRSQEVFSLEHLQARALELAAAHQTTRVGNRGFDLLARLEDNKNELVRIYQALTSAERDEPLTPSAEWLVDNFHIVKEQFREVRQDLPRRFYRELPKLEAGEFAGFPRIYQLACESVAHSDNRLEAAPLKAFFEAYQTITPLQIGEIWAFPISLRLALIENLRRLAVKILEARRDRHAADQLADELAEFSGKKLSGGTFELLAKNFDDGRLTDKFSQAFLVQLTARLHESDDYIGYELEKLQHRLLPEEITLEQLARREHNRQAAAQISVSNIITSMRLLSTLDWRVFFESVSLVERVLREDPAQAYGKMDFTTRDGYRRHVERIARRTRRDEISVARRAVQLSAAEPNDARKNHIGYFLNTDEGLAELEHLSDCSLTLPERGLRFLRKQPAACYLTTISLLTVVFLAALVYSAVQTVNVSVTALIFVVVLAIIPASELAVTLVNRLVNATLKPNLLPKMDLQPGGIPQEARTVVVIPTLLTDEKTIAELCGNLEVYHLANRDKELFFVLLGDLPDADGEIMPADAKLIEAARQTIRELNQKYESKESKENPAENQARFMFFTRRRTWNAGEGKWICSERKRGNLHAFNRLLRGLPGANYALDATVNFDFLKTIRYVITLDADTELPRETARKLIGTIEHPLNRPVFDQKLGRVTKGYAILQPRIEISLRSASRSHFARIFSSSKGYDPYTTAVSDVYQDLFSEGSYVGKGLYDVDAFEAALDRRIPENKLLSHDLFEGLYARVALLTDVALYDDYPSNYESYARRNHRWMRGDWQIARWLLPFVPDASAQTVRNRLPLLARWKILDNLRRSLLAPTLLLWLVTAWATAVISPLAAIFFALIILTAPLYLHVAATSFSAIETDRWKKAKIGFSNLWSDIKTIVPQMFFRFAFLAHEAALALDAIWRIHYRKSISKKRLLEWVTAAQSERLSKLDVGGYFGFMQSSPAIALGIFVLLVVFAPKSLIVAAPFLILWTLAPFLAYRLSLTEEKNGEKSELTADDVRWLRLAARRTWRYFETFVGETDHWLPPDNFQQDPSEAIAHRTSPTNIGLLLLSTVAARDFGYTGTLETVERIELTLMTLERLQRFRGHFLNWYDTRSLEPLEPQYISTVDSGNLAGHLIAVAEACLEFANAPLFGEHCQRGLLDTLDLLKNEVLEIEKTGLLKDTSEHEKLKTIFADCAIELRRNEPQSPEEWQMLFAFLATRGETAAEIFARISPPLTNLSELQFWTTAFVNLAKNFSRDWQTLFPTDPEKARQAGDNFQARVESIAKFCRRASNEMDFAFLYDAEKKVLTIGYRPVENTRDNSFYDLLASEARLASYLAVASGAVEQEHWFRLGRDLVGTDGQRALVSWSGTMFEYLMPLLVMRNCERTLLDETYRAVVRRQIEYGAANKVPWGVSESAYNARDLELNYQYAPFGVPGLGLKRGLAEDLVIAPYATALALNVAPAAAITNLRRLASEGMFARYGFFEAADYTKSRLPPGQFSARIEAYMSHHQGMIFVALGNFLHDDVMQKRFSRDPLIESADLLLQERVPRLTEELEGPRAAEEGSNGQPVRALIAPHPRRFASANQPTPQVCLLSNGNYTVMVTTAGSGFSVCGARAVNRWREDATRDDWGKFFYLRDVRSNAVWSSGFQPTLREPQDYEAIFTESKASFRRRDAGILTRTEIIVSTEDDAELRRVTVTNETARPREIEITSYAEIVINEQAADEAHRAFSNMFVETEYVRAEQTLLARRRHRSITDAEIWAAETVIASGQTIGETSFETDRARFLGRNQTTQNPQAITNENQLPGFAGEPLDPIFSLRVRVIIPPGESASLVFTTIIADSRENALALADKYRRAQAFELCEKLAWTRSQVELRYLGISTDEANLFQRLAGHLIYADQTLRPRQRILKLNLGTQKDLWKYGIGGDLPLMIVRISAGDDARRVIRGILRGYGYLRGKKLLFDLLILNDQPSSYEQSFNEDLQAMIRSGGMQAQMDKPGGIFLQRTDIMSEADRVTLHTAARLTFVTNRGTLEEELSRKINEPELPPQFIPHKSPRVYDSLQTSEELQFSNEYGGFAPDGSEYRITLENGKSTPAPWSNVIANESGFGFLTTETGAGATWSNNSHENRLTGWSNDAVSNPPPECVFLRDEETGSFWTPTALPIRENSPYLISHGQGYSLFQHTSHGISQELLVFAPVRGNVKISRLRLKNLTSRRRKISATYYVELVLGVNRAQSAPFIITELDRVTGAILARNPYNNEFGSRVAFAASSAETGTWTCDRTEFIGRNGTLARPAAMLRTQLSGASGAGLDPCAALSSDLEIQPGETREIVFLLGEEDSLESAQKSVAHFSQKQNVEEEFDRVREFWNKTIGTIEVKTPDESLNLMMNRWLIYQTLACRFWARTAFYQSSGAFGFRDQLQDAMALVYTRPDLARAHILHAAQHQFKEGDVQHWWHEPSNGGTRTRISDNLIWLVYVACFYTEKTADWSIFDEVVAFLDAPVLADGEMETYLRPIVASETATIFEHCLRAVEKSLATGAHGLPLIGAGDWSDGLNHVGKGGMGESVWMGWFLAKTLAEFAKICDERNEAKRAEKYLDHAKLLIENLEKNGWDGDWYLRAFFDDGTPLGSHTGDECQIDSIAQSWSLITGLGDKKRRARAMQSVDERLIKPEQKLALLLTPPFDKTALDPGYIKGYPPGIRENGGQYTHAAAWTIIAFAKLGMGDKAHQIFSLINPINHVKTPEDLEIYKTEPYAVAADVYFNPQHTGRGGWTWYTGAAGWLYRAALENILGFQKQGETLSIEPCIPRDWKEFEITYRHKTATYRIRVENPRNVGGGAVEIEADGKKLLSNKIELADDGQTHNVRVILTGMAAKEEIVKEMQQTNKG